MTERNREPDLHPGGVHPALDLWPDPEPPARLVEETLRAVRREERARRRTWLLPSAGLAASLLLVAGIVMQADRLEPPDLRKQNDAAEDFFAATAAPDGDANLGALGRVAPARPAAEAAEEAPRRSMAQAPAAAVALRDAAGEGEARSSLDPAHRAPAVLASTVDVDRERLVREEADAASPGRPVTLGEMVVQLEQDLADPGMNAAELALLSNGLWHAVAGPAAVDETTEAARWIGY